MKLHRILKKIVLVVAVSTGIVYLTLSMGGIYHRFSNIDLFADIIFRDIDLPHGVASGNPKIHTPSTYITDTGISEDSIEIPTIDLWAKVGVSEGDLRNGAWLKSNTHPGNEGNVVMVGHRFSFFQGKRAFFPLHRVELGDKVNVNWQGKEYTYRIIEVKNVKDTVVEIERDTPGDNILTLYTCDLVKTDERLVVVAELAD